MTGDWLSGFEAEHERAGEAMAEWNERSPHWYGVTAKREARRLALLEGQAEAASAVIIGVLDLVGLNTESMRRAIAAEILASLPHDDEERPSGTG